MCGNKKKRITNANKMEKDKTATTGVGNEENRAGKIVSASLSTPQGSASDSDIVYKDVVIIGNGPSGICLSYMLAGHWPYYTGAAHPNEYLQLRLHDCSQNKSLVHQDIEYLADGLEGRSSNPIALLFDALFHPNADLGVQSPSLLRWERHEEREISHVVLGSTAEGGAWQMMDGKLQTLSFGDWMELPEMPFREWLARRNNHEPGSVRAMSKIRASMEDVREYYKDFIRTKGLLKYFENYSTVTSVEKVCINPLHHQTKDQECGEDQGPCCANRDAGPCKNLWEVRGVRKMGRRGGDIAGWRPQEGGPKGDPETLLTSSSTFCYRTSSVVLATGSYDLPNRLKVPGQDSPRVIYSLPELERLLQRKGGLDLSEPLVIVGAGLSAADAIFLARAHRIPVVHVFRKGAEDEDSSGGSVFRKLPAALYPEYHEVHRLMRGGVGGPQKEGVAGPLGPHGDWLYQSLPLHNVVEFCPDGRVILRDQKTGGERAVDASYSVVLIGSKPDLGFLPQGARNLGNVPGMPIDPKYNPIDINPTTYQSVAESGLYAMGPLVGDNFVRFVLGGALSITSHLWRVKEGKC